MNITNNALTLGIDIGTTSVSAQLVDLCIGDAVRTYSFDHNAGISVDGFDDAYAQDANKLVSLVADFVDSATSEYDNVKSIGVTGQMHGIVCLDKSNNILSPLYTWQNRFGARCADDRDTETISDEIARITGVGVPTGYGLATLYALKRLKLLPEHTAKISTVMDLAAARLCNADAIYIHPTNAASLGLYNITSREFMVDKISILGIDPAMLPRVCADGALAGYYKGIPVTVSIGDNQAGAYGSLRGDDQILINVGTSGQISVITDNNALGGEPRPYFDGKILLSGSILCGGSAYAALADFFGKIATALGSNVTRGDIYACMNDMALDGEALTLDVSTAFAGTREDASVRGHIKNIGLDNFTPAQLTKGVVTGIISEMFDMYCGMTVNKQHITEAVVSGNAMRRNPALRQRAGEIFNVAPRIPKHTEEAAFGAALYAAVSVDEVTRDDAARLIHYI